MSKMSPKQLRLLTERAFPTGAHVIALGPLMLAIQTRKSIPNPAPVQATAARTPRVR